MSVSPQQRIAPLGVEQASEIQLDALQRARRRYGWTPNTIRVMARSHSAAHIYLDADQRNQKTTLSDLERELVAVATAQHNRCEYCLTAHSVNLILLGAQREDVQGARAGTSDSPRSRAILRFTEAILRDSGAVADDEISAAVAAGVDETTLVDVVAVVAENILGNFVNTLADSPIDRTIERAAVRFGLTDPAEAVL